MLGARIPCRVLHPANLGNKGESRIESAEMPRKAAAAPLLWTDPMRRAVRCQKQRRAVGTLLRSARDEFLPAAKKGYDRLAFR